MANFLYRDDLPSNYSLFLYGDVHVGSKAFHLEAFQEMVRRLKRKRHGYAICMGDLVEGQTTQHPHYDHTTIDQHSEHDLHTPEGQFDFFEDLIRSVASRHLGIAKGNHDWRYDKVKRFVPSMCRNLGVPYLGPRAMLRLNDLDVFISHIGKSLPKGAKDTEQRQANQRAALKRNLEGFYDSADIMAYGHIHKLKVRRPVWEPTALMRDDDNKVRMRTIDPAMFSFRTPSGFKYVHPELRYYVATGTFRRSGVIQDITQDGGYDAWDDYSEKFAYAPDVIGFAEFTIKKDRISDAREVVL